MTYNFGMDFIDEETENQLLSAAPTCCRGHEVEVQTAVGFPIPKTVLAEVVCRGCGRVLVQRQVPTAAVWHQRP